MRRILFIAAAILLTCAARASAQTPVLEPVSMPWHIVDRIVAGNVIEVRGEGPVRLAGIDDGGELSRAFLGGLISSQAVRVMPTTYSSGGMTEAYVFVPDGRCVNVEMVRFGYARARITPGFDRAAEFRGLQEDAERLKRGLWAPAHLNANVAIPPQFPASRRGVRTRRGYFAAGGGAGGASLDATDSAAVIDAGVLATSAFGFYLSAGHIRDAGDPVTAAADRAWHGSAGILLVTPIDGALRPYARAGGGYMRLESSGAGEVPKRDRPFWEAGGGLMIGAGPVHIDFGYTYARVDGLPIARIAGLAGIRF